MLNLFLIYLKKCVCNLVLGYSENLAANVLIDVCEVLEEREEAKFPQTWNLRMKRATLKALMRESGGSDGDNENLFNKELSSVWRWCGGCWCRRQS